MSIEKSFPVTRVPAKKFENFFKLYIHEIKQKIQCCDTGNFFKKYGYRFA